METPDNFVPCVLRTLAPVRPFCKLADFFSVRLFTNRDLLDKGISHARRSVARRFYAHLRKGVCFFTILPAALGATSFAPQDVLPLTADAVETFTRSAEEGTARALEDIVSLSDDQRTPQKLMAPWNRFGNDFLATLSILNFLKEHDVPSQDAASLAIQEMIGSLFESLVLDPAPYQSLIKYAELSLDTNRALSSYDFHVIYLLLESCEGIKYSLSLEEQERLQRLKELCATKEMKPFMHLKGLTAVKTSIQKDFSVFCLNTCFVPGNMPLIYGGVAPWKERVGQVAATILASDADVVCLQEVHGQDACMALYEKLKSDYAHFYVSIGPRVLGFSVETLGLPSGLFVASKFPIEQPHFTLFPVSGLQMNYGVFDFIINNGSGPIAHIYTTHLQSLNHADFPEIRKNQFISILEKMERDHQENENLAIPYFLCGDLNVPFGSGEPSEVYIRTYFQDAYNQDRLEVTQDSRTCTEYFTQSFLSAIDGFQNQAPVYEILDYALLLKTLPSCLCRVFDKNYLMETNLIPTSDLASPGAAISDHHALLTRVTYTQVN